MLRLLTLGALGYLGYRFYRRQSGGAEPAVAAAPAAGDIRDAGPEAMRDKPAFDWSRTDEALDESFPASDPPGNY